MLIVVEDTSRENCISKIEAARREIESLLVPVFDDYKRQQLIQLAIINGTYRERRRPMSRQSLE